MTASVLSFVTAALFVVAGFAFFASGSGALGAAFVALAVLWVCIGYVFVAIRILAD